MSSRYDFVIFGASRLAALLCGLLAHRHGAQVLRVADPVPRQRLPRHVDIALPFATRPASWSMLRAGMAETAALLADIGGADALARADVKVVADLPETAVALAHMVHLAAGHGMPSHDGRFRNIPHLAGDIELADSAVQTVESRRVTLAAASSSGGPELTLDGEVLAAGQIVLADDAAILAALAAEQLPGELVAEPRTATLTAPAKRLAAPVMRYPDRGVTLLQRSDGAVLALISGPADIEARLGSCLAGPFPLQRRATTRYRRLATGDGAPVVGRLAPSSLFVIAGLGSAGAFLAPPLARLLAGVPTDDEAAWFGAHAPAADRASVADFAEARS